MIFESIPPPLQFHGIPPTELERLVDHFSRSLNQEHAIDQLIAIVGIYPSLSIIASELEAVILSALEKIHTHHIIDVFGISSFVLACASHVASFRERVWTIEQVNNAVKGIFAEQVAHDFGDDVERCRLSLALPPLVRTAVYTI